MRKRWVWSLCGAGVLVLGFATILLMRLSPTALPQVPFPNGTSTRVVKVSFGTNHMFSAEPFWKKSLRKVTPKNIEKILGPFTGDRRSTAYDSLVIYLEPLQG